MALVGRGMLSVYASLQEGKWRGFLGYREMGG